MNTTPTATTKGYAVAAGEGERIWIVGDTMTFKATGESTGGGLCCSRTSPRPAAARRRTSTPARTSSSTSSTARSRSASATSCTPSGRAASPTCRGARSTTSATPRRPRAGSSWASRPAASRASSASRVARATDDGPAPPLDEDEIARTTVGRAEVRTRGRRLRLTKAAGKRASHVNATRIRGRRAPRGTCRPGRACSRSASPRLESRARERPKRSRSRRPSPEWVRRAARLDRSGRSTSSRRLL